MSIEAMKQALDALEHDNPAGRSATITALREAIAEAEKQEPVAFRNTETGEFCTGGFLRKDWAKWQPLYAAPREWVGLTEKEAWECWVSQDHTKSWQNIEAKLKEKNG